ncbi:DUF4352 domain-containing protein (plasmid) [Shinella sp. WSC3-e]|nr:DUF4352 domain-containing protein [Shinella sp. WSC3-e]
MLRLSIANGGALALAAVCCYAMQTTKPSYVDVVRTIPVQGRVDEQVRSRDFNVLVGDVALARNLRLTHKGKERLLTTGGLWAVVTVTVTANRHPVALYRRTWSGPDAITFDESRRAPSLLPTEFVVGQTVEGRLVFEITSDQARNATLQLSRNWIKEFDSETRIRLTPAELQSDGRLPVADAISLEAE